MGANTSIEWCDYSFNPWIGCTKVSPGCANCYAETQDRFRRWTPDGWGKGKPRRRTSEANWRKPIKWDKEVPLAKHQPCGCIVVDGELQRYCGTHISGFLPNPVYERPRVFCASLADVFDEEVPMEWRLDLFSLIDRTPNLDWLLLTKRPENIGGMLDEISIGNFLEGAWSLMHMPNLWLGTSAEDQQRWDERVPLMLSIPAAVHFVSAEPLLGLIDIGTQRPDWIIVGGESGPMARPMRLEWVRSLRDQSRDHSAFFFKQWGGTNKKKAGRILDGATYDEFPRISGL